MGKGFYKDVSRDSMRPESHDRTTAGLTCRV